MLGRPDRLRAAQSEQPAAEDRRYVDPSTGQVLVDGPAAAGGEVAELAKELRAIVTFEDCVQQTLFDSARLLESLAAQVEQLTKERDYARGESAINMENFKVTNKAYVKSDNRRVELEARCAELEKENEALRKDAERYRWLRDKSVPPHNFYIAVPDEFHGVSYKPQEVDAAIDAAIEKGRSCG